jgi:hypothetical protein
VEVLKFESAKDRQVNNWIQKSLYRNGEEKWGIIARSTTKDEAQCLTLGFKHSMRARLKLQSNRVERVEEETVEPEICEFHVKSKEGILELYSFSAKQRSSLLVSLAEEFGKDSIQELTLSKDAMKSLMTEAIEVTSVTLSSLGNPFFSDATLTGTDPSRSKTYRELMPSGDIRSFRGKFQGHNDEASSTPLILTVSAKCKLRFFGGQSPVLQADVEEFVEKVSNIAQLRKNSEATERDVTASL